VHGFGDGGDFALHFGELLENLETGLDAVADLLAATNPD
jgi:hypothetical protein